MHCKFQRADSAPKCKIALFFDGDTWEITYWDTQPQTQPCTYWYEPFTIARHHSVRWPRSRLETLRLRTGNYWFVLFAFFADHKLCGLRNTWLLTSSCLLLVYGRISGLLRQRVVWREVPVHASGVLAKSCVINLPVLFQTSNFTYVEYNVLKQ